MALISNIGLLTVESLTGEPNNKEPNFDKEPSLINDEVETILIGDFCFFDNQWSTSGGLLEIDGNRRK